MIIDDLTKPIVSKVLQPVKDLREKVYNNLGGRIYPEVRLRRSRKNET